MPRKTTKPSQEHKRRTSQLPVQVKKEDALSSSKNKNQGKIALRDETKASTLSPSKDLVSADASDEDQVSTTITSIDEKKEGTSLYRKIYYLSKRGRVYLVKKAALALPGIIVSVILILLGFKDLPKTVPLLTIIKEHPVGTPLIGAALLLFGLVPLVISFFPEPHDNNKTPKRKADQRNRRWIIATATSTLSFFVSSTLLAIVLVRPTWCPTTLCAPPERIPITRGFHDNNLEVYFTAFQSASFVIPGDPAHYSLDNLPQGEQPQSIGAVRIGGKSTFPYRVAIGIHSLQQGSYGLVIKKVELVLEQIPPMPNPLQVLNTGTQRTYQSNVYQVNYMEEDTGAVLAATYLPNGYPQPGKYVQLLPGESDELDVQVNSNVSVDLKFRVQITYRVFNETESHTLLLPNVFEVVFSKQPNWHLYQLQGGHLVASS